MFVGTNEPVIESARLDVAAFRASVDDSGEEEAGGLPGNVCRAASMPSWILESIWAISVVAQGAKASVESGVELVPGIGQPVVAREAGVGVGGIPSPEAANGEELGRPDRVFLVGLDFGICKHLN